MDYCTSLYLLFDAQEAKLYNQIVGILNRIRYSRPFTVQHEDILQLYELQLRYNQMQIDHKNMLNLMERNY